MKVPTYASQVKLKPGGVGRGLNARVSPQVAGAPGQAAAQLGDAIFEFGIEKLKIQAEGQAKTSAGAMEIELQAISDEAAKQPATEQSQADTIKKMRDVYTAYSKGARINPVTGKKYMNSEAARNLFAPAGQVSLQRYIADYKKTSNSKILELAKQNGDADINTAVKSAINISLTPQDRLNAVTSIFAQEAGEDGFSKGYLPRFNQKGVFNAKEILARRSDALQDIVFGSLVNHMGNNPEIAVDVANLFASGDIDETFDPVIAGAFEMLEPDEQTAIVEKSIDYANKLLKQSDDAAKRKQDADDAKINDIKMGIYSVDKKRESDVNKQLQNFQYLIDTNNLNATERKNMERILGLETDDQDGKRKESDRGAINAIEMADLQNRLTFDLVAGFSDKLTESDYQKYFTAVRTEQGEAVTEGKATVSRLVGYDRYKDSLSEGIRGISSTFNLRAVQEFRTWLNTDPNDQDPMSGGRGATYDVIIKKAEQIGRQYQEPMRLALQQSFDSSFNLFEGQMQNIAALNRAYPEYFPFAGTQVPGARIQHIENYITSLPAAAKTLPSVMSVVEQLRVWKREQVQ
jgi:hypothetical protein